jgi:hypothetical protein
VKRFKSNDAYARFDLEALYIYLIDILRNKGIHQTIESVNLGTPPETKMLNRKFRIARMCNAANPQYANSDL